MVDKIDKTIESICDFVQQEISGDDGLYKILPDMITALAELVTARAKLPKD